MRYSERSRERKKKLITLCPKTALEEAVRKRRERREIREGNEKHKEGETETEEKRKRF